jgi:multidrug efflux pump subunit AcrB
MSMSRPGVAILTVQFKVGVPRTEALVRLHDTIRDNADWLPKGLGVMDPLIKPKGVDDVPIVTLTLFSKSEGASAYNLERVAHSMEADLKRVKGTQDVQTLGGPDRAVLVQIVRIWRHGARPAHGIAVGQHGFACRRVDRGQQEREHRGRAIPLASQ